MTKGFIYKTFFQWYKKNFKSLAFSIIPTVKRKNYFVFILSGITPHIKLSISSSGNISCYTIFQGKEWDCLAHFDIYEKRTPNGQYFCSECLSDHIKYFDTRSGLWEDHSFRPLFEWVDDNLVESNYLCFFGGENWGYTESTIIDFENLNKANARKDHIHTIPIL